MGTIIEDDVSEFLDGLNERQIEAISDPNLDIQHAIKLNLFYT